MAELWLARQGGESGSGPMVAIKKIADSLGSDPEFVRMFLNEARVVAQLQHPGIVEIVGLGEHSKSVYIAMEYIPGATVGDLIKAGQREGRPLPMPIAVRLISLAADALGYAHTKVGMDGKRLRLVHRDVSPQNLILTSDGRLKVVDFGLARRAGHRSTRLEGQVYYMSPEQARGEELDHRSDIFSLGVVLFEALAGTRPFPHEESLQALAAVGGNDPIPKIRTRRPEVPADLEAIVARALARAPPARYQTAQSLRDALDGWLKRQGAMPSSRELASLLRAYMGERRAREVAQSAKNPKSTAAATEKLRRPPMEEVQASVITDPMAYPGEEEYVPSQITARMLRPGTARPWLLFALALALGAFWLIHSGAVLQVTPGMALP
jgi:serine/threonine-protein kinase